MTLAQAISRAHGNARLSRQRYAVVILRKYYGVAALAHLSDPSHIRGIVYIAL